MSDSPPRLEDYVLLGRSGLRISRLCLGTMTGNPGFLKRVSLR